jgi:predicted helicase
VYEEFENICFVDTLDNTSFEGKQLDLFAMTVENTARIKRQNDRTISVIIGNPPYNANQQNENDNNKNRSYPAIDKLIKESYIQESTAQKTKLYDMYSRFFRWGSDRLGENGILAFVTNSSFIDARTFDGFRKVISQDFSHIYVIDLGGDVRKNPKISGTKHNVFGIQIGVAISFLVRKKSNKKNIPCQVFYARRDEFDTAKDKLQFLAFTSFSKIDFDHVIPNDKYDWINQTDNDFEKLLPLVNKNTKLAKNQEEEQAIFKFFSTGVSTNRDQWVIDLSTNVLSNKMKFFINLYNNCNNCDAEIKWSRNLKERYNKGLKEVFDEIKIKPFSYRPFYSSFIYDSLLFIDERGYAKQLGEEKLAIAISGIGASKPFQSLITNQITCLDFLEKTQCLPLYRYDKEGKRIDNITDWGLKQIQTHYQDETITKIDIFHYTYAVLHNPAYRTKYELNLKREFPRLPYYENFPKWVNWGKQLMEIHINYETVTPYNLTRVDIPLKDNQKTPKPKLKADKTKDSIILDDVTTLANIPKIAWEYMLGNRSALEWILDQYKEKKPKDPTIAEKFNTYRFADYKQQVIDLLMRVCTVSVETMKIIREMSESG